MLRLAFAPRSDVWGTPISVFNAPWPHVTISDINDFFKKLKIEDTIEGLKEYSEKLKHADITDNIVLRFKQVFNIIPEEKLEYYKNNFMKEIWRAYAPKETGLTWTRPAAFNITGSHECWVEGEVYAVPFVLFLKIFKAK